MRKTDEQPAPEHEGTAVEPDGMLRGPLLVLRDALRVVQIGFGSAEQWRELLQTFRCASRVWAWRF